MPRKSRRTNHPSNMKSTPLVKYKAVAYCRLSNTNEESESLKTQMDYIEKYIFEQPDMELTVRFCDEGQTGTNYNRRGFQDMMEAIRNRGINCVVVKDLSRLGRNFLETGKLIEITLPSLNVRLIAINDFYDSAMELSVNDALQFELQNLANEYYSKDVSLKTSSAMTTLREKGAFLGNYAPYGYQKHANDKHKLVVDIPAAEIVRHIFEMKAKGMSYGAIARHLTAEGIASPRIV